jgi:Domain of unknown function (DUF4439)
MADDSGTTVDARTETTALRDALAAEHAAVWGYGVVGAALAPNARQPAVDSEGAHRDVRDRLVALLDQRKADPVPAQGAYALPFPVLSAVDAARLAVVLEDGVASAWVHVLGGAADRDVRQLAVDTLSAAEVRAVAWRSTAGQTPVTNAFPGLPAQ